MSRLATLVMVMSTATVLATASPAAGMDVESECPPWPARFEKTWETVDAASGQVTRSFGTFAWTRSGLDFDIRNGFAVQMCLSSIDAEAGFSSGVFARVRGPEVGRVPHEDVTGIGFGFVPVPLVPTDIPAGRHGVEGPPASGINVALSLSTSLGMLLVGGLVWHVARERSRGGRAGG